jgi:hypothetical protein
MVLALSMVSAVVKVLETMSTKVVSGSSPVVALFGVGIGKE